MTILKTAAILALAGLLVSTSFATAGGTNPLSGPIRVGPATPGPVEADPGNNRVAPEFSADVVRVTPHAVTCSVGINGFIWFRNVGTETIPAGSVITVKWPDGNTTIVTVDSDMKPGAAIDISVPPGVDFESFGQHCSAKAIVA